MRGDAAWPDGDVTPIPEVELDARPVLAAGGEPFGAIMEALDGLAPGATLVLRTPFEPRPLHRVLGQRGFVHLARENGAGDWETRYSRPSDPEPLVLDVRGLEPPEPLERTIAALDDIGPDRALVQVNDRAPAFLIPLLDERGLRYRITQDARGTLTTIWRRHAA